MHLSTCICQALQQRLHAINVAVAGSDVPLQGGAIKLALVQKECAKKF
jgi:hypothetical protein